MNTMSRKVMLGLVLKHIVIEVPELEERLRVEPALKN